jgi:hypothetical protein
MYRGNVRSSPEAEVDLGGSPPIFYKRDSVIIYSSGPPVASTLLGPFIIVDEDQELCMYEQLRAKGEGQSEISYISTGPRGLIQHNDGIDILSKMRLL